MKSEAEDDETKAQRIRGLKGVIRRVIRTKRSLKAKAQTLALPKWWDGVMCVRAWATNTEYPSGPKDLYSRGWFGQTLEYANNHKTNRFFMGEFEEIPQDAPKGKTEKAKKAQEEWNKAVGKRNEQYKQVGEALLKVATQYSKWLFTIALPAKGYNLVEYQPTEASFPQEEVMETRSGKDGYTYHKTGKFRPSGTRMMLGLNTDGYSVKDNAPPLPDMITLLLEPKGELAWLISSKSGEARWEALGKQLLGDIRGRSAGFSFRDKFRKVGDQFVHIVPDYVDGSKYQSEVPQKVGDIVIKEVLNSQTLVGENPPNWAYKEGIGEITKNLFDDLCGRKEWSGTPLVNISLSGSGRKRC
jgi:hypothetical protein